MVAQSVIAYLVHRALVVEISQREIELGKQRQSLSRLLARCDSGNLGTQFLTEYDAVMRLCEMSLIRNGYVFGSTPHLAMNIIAKLVCPAEDIRSMSKLRHSVKKGYDLPTERDVETVRRIRKAVFEAMGD